MARRRAADFAATETSCTEPRLSELAGGITHLLERNSDFDTTRLRPPALRVTLSSRHLWRVNAFFVSSGTSGEIVVGRGLCVFLHQYARAAATYFLPTRQGGPRPSELWPAARDAVATTVEWLSAPSSDPRFVDFPITPHQADVARIFALYTLRFTLCHEMAHALAGHRPPPPGSRASGHQQELDADRLGLRIQMAALPNPTQAVNGLAGAAYSTHATELLRLRLMLVAGLIDHTRWQTLVTHPPLLLRSAMLMRVADGIVRGGGRGLASLHDQLAGFNGEIIGQAGEEGDRVAASTRRLLEEQAARLAVSAGAGETVAPNLAATLRLRPTDPPPSVATRLLATFDRSPLGVLRGLDPQSARRAGPGPRREAVRELLADRVIMELPPEFGRFLRLSPADRTDAILRIPSGGTGSG